MSSTDLTAVLIDAWLTEFRKQKSYIDNAAAQLTDDQFRARPTPDLNSVQLVIRHLAGNLRSRWTDWLTTDGEKPDRKRESEFIDDGESRESLMKRYEAGWKLALDAIAALTPADLARTITIRSEPHSVPLAINRQLAHCAYHAGQVMLIARSLVGNAGWKWQTVPPGGTAAFNKAMADQHGQPRR